MGDERRLFVEHRLFSATRCRCGWEGDSAITHVLDALKTCPDLLRRMAGEVPEATRKPIRCEDEGHEFACRLARKTCWTCTGAPSQRQDSLADQLRDVLVLARAHGMYDAEDWIVTRLEVRASAARGPERSAEGDGSTEAPS